MMCSPRAGMAVVVFLLTLTGCAFFHQTAPPLYQDSSLTVRLAPNPAPSQTDGTIRKITPKQFALALRELRAQKRPALLQSLISPPQPEAVFPEDALPHAAKEIHNALKVASPSERVTFVLTRPGTQQGHEETSGVLFLDGPFLHITLTKFRSPDRVSYEGVEEDFELVSAQAGTAVQKERTALGSWRAKQNREIVLDLRRFMEESLVADSAGDQRGKSEPPAQPVTRPPQTAAVAGTVPPPAPRSAPAPEPDTLEMLQRQIRELTDANQALRAKLLEYQGLRDQSEKLEQLRQELAETKQALADKVLEINRLKNKAGGSSKGKGQSPSGR